MSEPDLSACPRLAAHARLQLDRVRGEPVLLYPEGILELNATSHAILQQCDGQTSIREILARLAEIYEADAAELREDVLGCLGELRERRLLLL